MQYHFLWVFLLQPHMGKGIRLLNAKTPRYNYVPGSFAMPGGLRPIQNMWAVLQQRLNGFDNSWFLLEAFHARSFLPVFEEQHGGEAFHPQAFF